MSGMMGNRPIVKLMVLQLCLLGSFCQTKRHSETSVDVQMERRICPTKYPEIDDTLGYDLISQFGLDKADTDTGIRRIVGSNLYQTAYEIRMGSNLRFPTRAVFSHGLPVQFSFMTTIRMTAKAAHKEWDVFRIEDAEGNLQFSVNINGRNKSVRLKLTNHRNKVRSVDFSLDNQYFIKFFNSEWHKLSVSVSHHLVQLYVDCDKVGSSVIPRLASINSSGQIVSGRRADGNAVAFDLQWLMLYCDPKTVERDQCRELYGPREKAEIAGLQLSQQDDADDEGEDDDDDDDDDDSQYMQTGYDGQSDDGDHDHQTHPVLELEMRRPLAQVHSSDLKVTFPMAAQIQAGPLLVTASTTLDKKKYTNPLEKKKSTNPLDKKKSTKVNPPQLLKSGPIGPPGPPGNPGLPGLPGLPCNCRPEDPPPPRLPFDIQGLERDHGIS